MPLPGVCPVCGATFSLEQALGDGEARQALAAALLVPPEIGARVVRYLGLHAPAGRRIQWPKLTRLLQELTERLSSAQVSRRGVTQAAPLAVWAQALDEVLAAREAGTLSLPLDGHGYLDEIAWRLADRAKGQGPRAKEEMVGAVPLHPSHLPADLPAGRAKEDRAEGQGRAALGARSLALGQVGAILAGLGHTPEVAP